MRNNRPYRPAISHRGFPFTTMSLSAAAQFGTQHLTRGIGRLSQHVFVEGRGSYLTTDTGKRLLDMTSYVSPTYAAALV